MKHKLISEPETNPKIKTVTAAGPDKNVPVKSKIEYILYKYLHEAQKEKRLDFKYEEELVFKNKDYDSSRLYH